LVQDGCRTVQNFVERRVNTLCLTELVSVAAKSLKIGCPFLFKGLIIGTCSYFGVDSATKKQVLGEWPS
jgi:hypothetical protein